MLPALQDAMRRPTRSIYFLCGSALPLAAFYLLNTGIATELWLGSFSPIFLQTLFAPIIAIIWSLAPAGLRAATHKWLRWCIGLHLVLLSTTLALQLAGMQLDPSSTNPFAIPIDVLVLILIPAHTALPSTRQAWVMGARSATVVALLASFLVIPVAMVRAEQISQGRDYCIVIPNQGALYGYHSPSMLDLSAWKMRAYAKWRGGADDLTDQVHGLLIFRDGERYAARNWSYMALNFVEDGAQKLPALDPERLPHLFPECQATRHFALHIPFWRWPNGHVHTSTS